MHLDPHRVSEVADGAADPDGHETADSIGGARRSLAEIRAREASDEQEASEHRTAELTHWQPMTKPSRTSSQMNTSSSTRTHEDY